MVMPLFQVKTEKQDSAVQGIYRTGSRSGEPLPGVWDSQSSLTGGPCAVGRRKSPQAKRGPAKSAPCRCMLLSAGSHTDYWHSPLVSLCGGHDVHQSTRRQWRPGSWKSHCPLWAALHYWHRNCLSDRTVPGLEVPTAFPVTAPSHGTWLWEHFYVNSYF